MELQEAQDRARGHVSPSRLAWLAALEARAHAGLGDAAASLAALARADRAIERAEPEGGRFATDFFDRPRLAGFRGTSHLLLGQPKAALADVLALRDPADVKGRSLARLDLAQAYVQDRAVLVGYLTAGATLVWLLGSFAVLSLLYRRQQRRPGSSRG